MLEIQAGNLMICCLSSVYSDGWISLGFIHVSLFAVGLSWKFLGFLNLLAPRTFQKSISMFITNVDGQRGWESGVLPQCGPELTVDSNPGS